MKNISKKYKEGKYKMIYKKIELEKSNGDAYIDAYIADSYSFKPMSSE